MRNFIRELIITLVVAIVVFLLLRLAVGSYTIVSQAMEPNIDIGQRILINKMAYKFGEPQRGDVIYYKSPDGDLDQMKRIIGIPGDIVEVRDGIVTINGHQITEPYVSNKAAYTVLQYQVAENNYFVLGDNRNNSNDSSTGWTVPKENILGKAWIFTWPPDKWGGIGNYDLGRQLAGE
jgi:signal peptidase I